MPHLLLIDDDEPLRKRLRLRLMKQGHQVMEAQNGREGLKLVSLYAFDLVVTDVVMPEKDGIEVAMEMKHHYPSIPVIGMIEAVRLTHAHVTKTMNLLGVRRTLEKPFAVDELEEAVAEALEWRKHFVPAGEHLQAAKR